MRRNAERDARSSELAEALGWRVVRVWECAVMEDPTGCVRGILGQ
jgi:DNA mismatch endonuclease (patch repair protein)